MKIFSYIISIIACVTIAINAMKVDINHPLEGESTVALIGIVAALCAIIIVILYRLAKKVDEKTK
ncbi:hypothetical protein RF683_01555 [Flavobacterium sp. 20NA77.7]|uniref:LPXTG-motif cell wall anchor domain-containing protein n=1 Tax=Flavobacterium nakdongensis TaxID=3073563 RepID=A0ABY9RAA6_9FLAO|nr:hypothetical protein [Flavobacterium sp. 20NA77.7]WMW78156.1 hypothetical protein RF683_01555 [Flavobacterium sp. 20NA77.7]